MAMNRKIFTTAIAFSLLAIAGCSSSDGNGSSDTVTRSGQAVDGYLLGAEVCVDVNLNSRCDDNEPSANTPDDAAEQGKFSISGIAAENSKAPTLVNAVKDQTVDSDNPDAPVSEDFNLKAPAGAKVVSPLSTVIQADVEDQLANDSSNSLSVDQAVQSAKQNLEQTVGDSASTIDVLNEDYVAAQQDSDAGKSTAAKKVAATARSLNQIIISTRTKVNDKISKDGNSDDKIDNAIFNTAISKVRNKISQVSQQVGSDIDSGVDPQEAANNAASNNQVDDSELNNVVNEVAQEIENLKNAEGRFEEDVTGGTGEGQ